LAQSGYRLSICALNAASGIQRDAKVANRNVRDFGWEIAHGAVTRRPPISLDTTVPRTVDNTHDVGVWDFVHRSRTILCRAVPNPSVTIRKRLRGCTARTDHPVLQRELGVLRVLLGGVHQPVAHRHALEVDGEAVVRAELPDHGDAVCDGGHVVAGVRLARDEKVAPH
jgi:hypothetical protein